MNSIYFFLFLYYYNRFQATRTSTIIKLLHVIIFCCGYKKIENNNHYSHDIITLMSMESFATININTEYGNYEWSGSKGTYYPTNKPTNKNLLLIIDIVMNQELSNDVDIIEIYDHIDFLVQYSVVLKKPVHQFRFCVSEELADTDFTVQFKKTLPTPKLPSGLPWIGRPPMKTKHQMSLRIPDISAQKAHFLLHNYSKVMDGCLCKSTLCTL